MATITREQTAQAEREWLRRAATITLRLRGGVVRVTSDDPGGVWRVRHESTGEPYAVAITDEERADVRDRLTRMLEMRKAG